MSDPYKTHRLLNELARDGIPERTDLWSRLRLRLKPYRPVNRALGWLTLAAVVMIVAVFGILLNMPTRNPFAAGSSTPTPAAAVEPIHSYRGMMLVHLSNLAEIAIQPPPGNAPFTQYQVYVWYDEPDELRLEFYRACTLQPVLYSNAGARAVGGRAEFEGPTFERCPQPEWISIYKGTARQAIHATTAKNYVQFESPYNEAETSGAEQLLANLMTVAQLIPSTDTSVANTLARFEQGYEDLRFGSDGAIAGRPVREFQRRFVKPDPAQQQPNMSYLYEGVNRLWLDRETLIPLAGERQIESGVVAVSWRFLRFEPNVEVDPSIFVYLPGRKPVTINGMNAAWISMAQEVPFPLYFPTDEVLNTLELAAGDLPQMPQFPEYRGDQQIVRQDFLYTYDPTQVVSGLTMWQGRGIEQVLAAAGFPKEEMANLGETDLSQAIDAPAGTLKLRITVINNIRWLAFEVGATAVALRVYGAIPTPDVAEFAAAVRTAKQVPNDSAAATPLPTPQTVTPTPNSINTPIPIPQGQVAVTIIHNGLKTRSVLQYGDRLILTVTYQFIDIDETYQAIAGSTPQAAQEGSTTFEATLISVGLPDGSCPEMTPGAPTVTPMPLSLAATPLTAAMTAYPGVVYSAKPTTIHPCDPSTTLTVAVDAADAVVIAWTVEAGMPITVEKVE